MNKENLSELSNELSVLSRAIGYANLSDASDHIALSQPQLSRIISKLEKELSVHLLERSSKRKSSWTKMAHELADFYHRFERKFDSEIHEIVKGLETTHLRVGTLEGISGFALKLCEYLLTKSPLKTIELDIYDLDDLSKLFVSDELDLIFTIQEPQRKKHKFRKSLGFQTIVWNDKNQKYLVVSPFEFGNKVYKKWNVEFEKAFISNSLRLRKEWMSHFGGIGTMPSSALHSKKIEKTDEEVLLLGADSLSLRIWERIAKLDIKSIEVVDFKP